MNPKDELNRIEQQQALRNAKENLQLAVESLEIAAKLAHSYFELLQKTGFT